MPTSRRIALTVDLLTQGLSIDLWIYYMGRHKLEMSTFAHDGRKRALWLRRFVVWQTICLHKLAQFKRRDFARCTMDDEQLALFLSAKPVEYLTGRKFPDWKNVRLSRSIPVTEDGGFSHDYIEKLSRAIADYQAELKAKSAEDLMKLYQEEKVKETQDYQAKAEREERQRFFSQPSAKADFVHWSKATYWTLEEAVALSFGKNPEVVTWKRVQEFINVSPFAKRYAQVRDLALRAKSFNQLYDPVLPGIFLAWVRRTEIEVPTELMEQVEKRGIVVADWKDNYDKVKEERDMLLADRDKIAGIAKRLIQERDELKDKVAELDSLAWEGFDPDSDVYPSELDIAMQAWRAITNRPHADLTAKEQIENWLNQNYPDRRTLSQEARQRIAVICNWEKSGGRPRSGKK